MGVLRSTRGSGFNRTGVRQEGSARRQEPQEAAVFRGKKNGPKAVMQGMEIWCRCERNAKGRADGTLWLTRYEPKRVDESRVTPRFLRA